MAVVHTHMKRATLQGDFYKQKLKRRVGKSRYYWGALMDVTENATTASISVPSDNTKAGKKISNEIKWM